MASPTSPGGLSKADEEIKKTVESYFKQLKDGCGARACGNEWCRSNFNCAVSMVRASGLRPLLRTWANRVKTIRLQDLTEITLLAFELASTGAQVRSQHILVH
jgi:hypothetical protein